MTFEEAVANYETVAMQLINSREAKREAEQTQAMIETVTRMEPGVQEGTNEKARQALHENALAGNEGYQEQRLEALRLARVVAEGEVAEWSAKAWVRQITAVATEEGR